MRGCKAEAELKKYPGEREYCHLLSKGECFLVTLILTLNRGYILSKLESKLEYLADEGKPPFSHTTEKRI